MSNKYYRDNLPLRRAICVLIREYYDPIDIESDDQGIDQMRENNVLDEIEETAREILGI